MAVTPIGNLAKRFLNMFRNYTEGPDAPELEALLTALNEKNEGVLASATIDMSTAPTATDTITIDGEVYEFVAAAGQVAADVNIAVARTGTAATDLANLVAAINALDPDGDHDSIFLASSATTPALANGTKNLFADIIGTNVIRIRSADAPGGNVIAPAAAADVDMALTDALTPAVAWSHANLNLSPFRVPGGFMTACEVTITAAMVTTGSVRLDFPFTVEGYCVTMGYTDATGALVVIDGAGADTILIDEGGIEITLGGGGAPDLQADDTFGLVVWGTAEAP